MRFFFSEILINELLKKLTLILTLSLNTLVHAYNDTWDLGRVKTFKGTTAEANAEAVNLVNALAKINAASIANNCGGITIDDINTVGTGDVVVYAPFLVNYQAGICNRNGIPNQPTLEQVIDLANLASTPLLINPPNIEGNIHIPNAIVGQQYTYDIADNVWSGLGELTTTTTIEPEGCFNINGNRVSGIPNAPAVCTVTHTVRNIANAEVSTNFIITIIPDPVQVALDKLNACAIANDCSQITINDILATGVDRDTVYEPFLDFPEVVGLEEIPNWNYLKSYRREMGKAIGVNNAEQVQNIINSVNQVKRLQQNVIQSFKFKQGTSGTWRPRWYSSDTMWSNVNNSDIIFSQTGSFPVEGDLTIEVLNDRPLPPGVTFNPEDQSFTWNNPTPIGNKRVFGITIRATNIIGDTVNWNTTAVVNDIDPLTCQRLPDGNLKPGFYQNGQYSSPVIGTYCTQHGLQAANKEELIANTDNGKCHTENNEATQAVRLSTQPGWTVNIISGNLGWEAFARDEEGQYPGTPNATYYGMCK